MAPIVSKRTLAPARLRLRILAMVGMLFLAGCVNTEADSDLPAAVEAVAPGEAEASGSEADPQPPAQLNEPTEPTEQSVETEQTDGAVEEEANGITDPNFDYSTVNYDLEPVGNALLGNRMDPNFPPPIIEPGLIRSGGVPPDGIPPIDRPKLLGVDEVDFLGDLEAVIAVEVDGEARAYPIRVLIWHEIVNDQFGETPVSITYCPLCNSALAFDRRLGERVLDFGTSGELYQSALVMYDRQTLSLWAHFTGQGLVGHYAGAQLKFIPAQTISWAEFRLAHPDGQVLSTDTGFERSYGTNPYPGYDFEGSDPIGQFFDGEIDRTLLAKARVVGISDEAGPVAVRFDDLFEASVIPITEAGRNLVVLHRGGLSSSLETMLIEGGRDIGQTGVFVAAAQDGTALTFGPGPGGFIDDQTGSTWNIVGAATRGPLAGQQLEPVSHLDTFWFAWATYRPGTVIIEPELEPDS